MGIEWDRLIKIVKDNIEGGSGCTGVSSSIIEEDGKILEGLEEGKRIEWSISNVLNEDKECYGKPCACLDCGSLNFCVEDPCADCEGKDSDRRDDFCPPPKGIYKSDC